MVTQTICPKCGRMQSAAPHKPLSETSTHRCVYETCGCVYKIKKNMVMK